MQLHLDFSPSFLGTLACFGASVTWAAGVSTYSIIAREYPPWLVNFTRAFLSFPLFFLLVILSAGSFSGALSEIMAVPVPNILWFVVGVVMSYAFGDVIFLWSTQGIGVSGALAIASTYPLWASLWDWLIRGQSMSLYKWIGLLCVVGGTIQVILSSQAPVIERSVDEESFLSKKSVGVSLAFLTSCMWSVNAYSVFRGGQGVSAPVGNVYRMGFALILAPLIGQLSSRRISRLLLPASVLKRYLWVFLLEGFGGTFAFMYGLSHAPLAAGSALSSLAPVLAVPASLLSGAERFSFARTLGVVLVVGGIVLLVAL